MAMPTGGADYKCITYQCLQKWVKLDNNHHLIAENTIELLVRKGEGENIPMVNVHIS